MESKFSELKKTNLFSNQFLDFYKEIFSVVEGWAKNNSINSDEKNKVFDQIKSNLNEKNPIINFQSLSLNVKYVHNIFAEIIAILIKFNDTDKNDLLRIQTFLQQTELSQIRLFFHEVATADFKLIKTISQNLDVAQGWIEFVVRITAKIVLLPYAKLIKSEIPGIFESSGKCPACGSIAAMGRIKEENGERILWCNICESEWYYKRLKCVYCGTENQQHLGHFTVEEFTYYRVDFCQKCGNYIKCIDERKIPEKGIGKMYLEEIASIPLDIIAEKKQYLQKDL